MNKVLSEGIDPGGQGVALGACRGDRLLFRLLFLLQFRERLPRQGALELLGPDAAWRLRHWTL